MTPVTKPYLVGIGLIGEEDYSTIPEREKEIYCALRRGEYEPKIADDLRVLITEIDRLREELKGAVTQDWLIKNYGYKDTP